MAILNTAANTIDTDKVHAGDGAHAEDQPRAAELNSDQKISTKPAAKKLRIGTATPKPSAGAKEVADKGAKPNTRGTEKVKVEASKGATKAEQVLKKLRSAKGATIDMLMEATGWQAHSVRGFLSATVKKKMKLTLIREIGKDGLRRYRIDDTAKPE